MAAVKGGTSLNWEILSCWSDCFRERGLTAGKRSIAFKSNGPARKMSPWVTRIFEAVTRLATRSEGAPPSIAPDCCLDSIARSKSFWSPFLWKLRYNASPRFRRYFVNCGSSCGANSTAFSNMAMARSRYSNDFVRSNAVINAPPKVFRCIGRKGWSSGVMTTAFSAHWIARSISSILVDSHNILLKLLRHVGRSGWSSSSNAAIFSCTVIARDKSSGDFDCR